MARLTEKALDVLHVLARAEVPFTASEVAAGVALRNGLSVWRPVGEAELMNGRLRRLEAKGLVERRGRVAFGDRFRRGAACWDITEAGRQAVQGGDSDE